MKTKQTPLWYFANTLKWILLLALMALALLPILWLLVSSFRTNLELQVSPFGWPAKMQWGNYANALAMASLPRLLLNSVVVAASAVVLNTLITSMAAFILSRE
ncbi:MAG: carbohydrate ABC transporter permease, partial [Sphaerochaeta sp.]|nr:carbohydrate ABC transporter permease [Sphaerochaeta sp.]